MSGSKYILSKTRFTMTKIFLFRRIFKRMPLAEICPGRIKYFLGLLWRTGYNRAALLSAPFIFSALTYKYSFLLVRFGVTQNIFRQVKNKLVLFVLIKQNVNVCKSFYFAFVFYVAIKQNRVIIKMTRMIFFFFF